MVDSLLVGWWLIVDGLSFLRVVISAVAHQYSTKSVFAQDVKDIALNMIDAIYMIPNIPNISRYHPHKYTKNIKYIKYIKLTKYVKYTKDARIAISRKRHFRSPKRKTETAIIDLITPQNLWRLTS